MPPDEGSPESDAWMSSTPREGNDDGLRVCPRCGHAQAEHASNWPEVASTAQVFGLTRDCYVPGCDCGAVERTPCPDGYCNDRRVNVGHRHSIEEGLEDYVAGGLAHQ